MGNHLCPIIDQIEL